jgi:2-dehydropantoate 2-reductase
VEPGVVQWDVKGDTTFGPFEPSPARAEEIERLADACTRGGMPAAAVSDARGAQWRKVIFNAATNPIGALTGLTHGRVCERADVRRLVSGLVDEGKAVAAAAGIELHEDPWEMNVLATKRGSAHYPSMLEDVEARRPTEIELITGSLVREAERLGVPVPLHTTLYRLIKAKEEGYRESEGRQG